ncbi:MAG: hypothetical protein Q9163_005499, partial [Psora crenata]
INEQGDGVGGTAEQIEQGEDGLPESISDPSRLSGRGGREAVEGRVGSPLEVEGGAADEGRGEAPGEGDEDDGEDVVEDGRGGGRG